MKIRLLRKWREYPIGSVMDVFDTTAKQLIRDQIAERYNGEFSPKQKMKTNFFKPK